MAVVESFVFQSPAMRRVAELVAHAASSEAPVLVVGESGTGKERIAREIHERSPRRGGRFKTVSCLALDRGFDWSTLVPMSRRGTLYVSQINALDAPRRLKLFRTLEAPATKARGPLVIVSATVAATTGESAPPELHAADLFTIRVPPLRERREDIVPLADALLVRVALRRGSAPFVLTPDAASALESHVWPGNVRELETVLARAVALTSGSEIGLGALPTEIAHATLLRSVPGDLASLQYREVVALGRDLLSREYLIAVLRDARGNVKHAATRAGIERESLHRLLKRYGLRAESFRTE